MEKRNERRWELSRAQPLEIRLDGQPVSLVNLSRGGVQILSPFLPSVSVPLSFCIDNQVFDLEGRIVWSSTCASLPGLHQLGVVFSSPPDSFVSAIEKMLEVF